MGCGREAAILPVALQVSAETHLHPGGELRSGRLRLLQELREADQRAVQREGRLRPAQEHVLRLLG